VRHLNDACAPHFVRAAHGGMLICCNAQGAYLHCNGFVMSR
jgi:hypothetical protein